MSDSGYAILLPLFDIDASLQENLESQSNGRRKLVWICRSISYYWRVFVKNAQENTGMALTFAFSWVSRLLHLRHLWRNGPPVRRRVSGDRQRSRSIFDLIWKTEKLVLLRCHAVSLERRLPGMREECSKQQRNAECQIRCGFLLIMLVVFFVTADLASSQGSHIPQYHVCTSGDLVTPEADGAFPTAGSFTISSVPEGTPCP